MNELQYESSPYLLQHAQNPVDWKAWNENSLKLAKESDKLIIVSIGYSTCHWCHVMEHESFEDQGVAMLMNDYFVSIKVDREERPDIDAHYMKAVQAMNQRGGWPLNVVCLPDGRPIWGGTYFRKHDWTDALTKLHLFFTENPEELYNYAEKLDRNIADAGKAPVKIEEKNDFDLPSLIEDWYHYFDRVYGGYGRAPKFMIPNSLNFLQRYSYLKNDNTGLDFIDLTLTRMAWGGLFDTVQGGFSRYSVDEQWHIPHFEKMLYDNAQLLSLYADGYKRTKNHLYKEVIEKTIDFITSEWSNGEGGFYSAYDADSLNESGKLEEGAYYSWTHSELEEIIGAADFPVFKEVFNIYPQKEWEHKYVLLQTETLDKIAAKYNLSYEKLIQKKKDWEGRLKSEREKRSKPRLDDKTLTSWNAMLIIGLLDAYSALGNKEYLVLAENIYQFISQKLVDGELNLKHTYKEGKATIDGFLEDYAFYISALVALYEHTLNTAYLNQAKAITDKVIVDFFDEDSRFFFFNKKENSELIHNTIETDDGVIPSANSQMVNNLLKLGLIFEDANYNNIAEYMLDTMKHNIGYAPYFSNWLSAELYYSEPAELLISGENALEEVLKIRKNIVTKTLILGSKNNTEIPYLKGKFKKDKIQFFYCTDRVCMQPQTSNEFLKESKL